MGLTRVSDLSLVQQFPHSRKVMIVMLRDEIQMIHESHGLLEAWVQHFLNLLRHGFTALVRARAFIASQVDR